MVVMSLANWDNNQQISGTHGVGVVSHSLTGLTKGTTYYYTTKVSNSGGNVWGDVKTFVPANTALNKDTIPDLALWLDATDINGDGNADSISDGTALASWVDKSNACHFSHIKGTGANQPLYKTAIFGTKPGVRFDGVNDFFAAAPFVRLQVIIMYLSPVSVQVVDWVIIRVVILIKEAGWDLSPGSGNGTIFIFRIEAVCGSRVPL